MVQAPGNVEARPRVFAAEGVGRHPLFAVAIVDAGVDARAVGRAEGRVIVVNIGGACVAVSGRAGALVEAEDEIVSQLVVVKQGIDCTSEDGVGVVDLVVGAQRGGEVLAGQAIVLVLMFASEMFVRSDRVGEVWISLPVIGSHLALVVGRLCDNAQLAVHEDVRRDERTVDFLTAALLHVAVSKPAGGDRARIVKRAPRADIDVARDRVARHRGHDRLLHDDLAGDRRWDVVEAALAALRADDAQAVERQGGPVYRRAAQVYVAGLTLVALHPDAWKAADGEGDVLVGQVADGVGGEDADQAVGGALHQQRCGDALGDRAARGDDHFADGLSLGVRHKA